MSSLVIYVLRGADFGECRPGKEGVMTVSPNEQEDVRRMYRNGTPRSRIVFHEAKEDASRMPPPVPGWLISLPTGGSVVGDGGGSTQIVAKHRPNGTASGAEEMEQVCLDALPIPPRDRHFHVLERLTQPFSWSRRVLNLLRDGTHWNAWSHSRSGEIIARNSTT